MEPTLLTILFISLASSPLKKGEFYLKGNTGNQLLFFFSLYGVGETTFSKQSPKCYVLLQLSFGKF